MKISARNQFFGRVIEVHRGAVNGTVKVDIGAGNVFTASITNEAIDDLELSEGDVATVFIKATDVLIGK